MHRFTPLAVILVIIEILLFVIWVDILVYIPYEIPVIAGIFVILLLGLLTLMIIIARAIKSLWKIINTN
jgi:hypothetical protein